LAHIIWKVSATQQLWVCSIHLYTVATLPWEKLFCGFGTILANLPQQNAGKLILELEEKI